jgi:hypothetical protein
MTVVELNSTPRLYDGDEENHTGGNMKNADDVLLKLGTMLYKNLPREAVEVDPASAKERFRTHVRSLVKGRPTFEMTAEDIYALVDGPDGEKKLPKDIVKALGLWRGSNYVDAFLAACNVRIDFREESRMNVGDIVKVVSPEDGLEGMTGKVLDIRVNGFIGVEFPGWGGGHSLDDILEEADGYYLVDEELEVLSD